MGMEATGDSYLTTVFFGNDICERDEYNSNDVQIVCFAPPLSKEGTAERVLSVKINVVFDA